MNNKGSYGGGFLLGLLLGLIGILLAIALNTDETRRGSVHGFLFRIVLAIVGILVLIIYLKLLSWSLIH